MLAPLPGFGAEADKAVLGFDGWRLMSPGAGSASAVAGATGRGKGAAQRGVRSSGRVPSGAGFGLARGSVINVGCARSAIGGSSRLDSLFPEPGIVMAQGLPLSLPDSLGGTSAVSSLERKAGEEGDGSGGGGGVEPSVQPLPAPSRSFDGSEIGPLRTDGNFFENSFHRDTYLKMISASGDRSEVSLWGYPRTPPPPPPEPGKEPFGLPDA